MKKITLFITLLTFSLGFAQDLPYDFETSPVTADFTAFDGGSVSVEAVAAAQSDGNTSNNLVKLVRDGGQVWAGAFTVTNSNFDFTTEKFISAKIWTSAPIGTKIMFKTENSADASNNSGEKNTFTTKTEEWETIYLDFTGVTNANQNKLVLIPANGVLGDGSATSIFYLDDIVQTETSGNSGGGGGTGGGGGNTGTNPDFPLDFETSPVTADFTPFDGGGITVEPVSGAQLTGNTSANIAKLVRDGGETWAGVALDLENNMDLNAKPFITAKIWTSAPIGTKVMFKTENSSDAGNNSGEFNVFTTKTGEWETLVFDFSSTLSNNAQNRLVIIPDNGVLGDGSANSTFYFDDIENSSVLSVDKNIILNVSMYPNPTTSRLTISAPNTIKSAAIYTILGKQVMSLEINKNSESIDVSNLATGMYLIKYSIDNAVGTAKFIKQ